MARNWDNWSAVLETIMILPVPLNATFCLLCTSQEKIYSMEVELITSMEHSFMHGLQSLRQLNNSQVFMEPDTHHFTAQDLYPFGSKFSVIDVCMDETTYSIKKAHQ